MTQVLININYIISQVSNDWFIRRNRIRIENFRIICKRQFTRMRANYIYQTFSRIHKGYIFFDFFDLICKSNSPQKNFRNQIKRLLE